MLNIGAHCCSNRRCFTNISFGLDRICDSSPKHPQEKLFLVHSLHIRVVCICNPGIYFHGKGPNELVDLGEICKVNVILQRLFCLSPSIHTLQHFPAAEFCYLRCDMNLAPVHPLCGASKTIPYSGFDTDIARRKNQIDYG